MAFDWNKISEVEKAAHSALLIEAELIKTEAQEQTPVDTGALHSSAFVETDAGGNIRVGFGGVATQINPKTRMVSTSYAVDVHENLSARHKVGNAKFLERPAMERAKGLSDRVGKRVASVMGRRP